MYIFCGLECVGHSVAYIANLLYVFGRCLASNPESCCLQAATNLAAHLPNIK